MSGYVTAMELATEDNVRDEKIRAEERERCAKLAESEPEMPGDMPNELRPIPLEDVLRAVCRATKKSIAEAIRSSK